MKILQRTLCTLLLLYAGSSLCTYAQENVTYFLHTIEKGQSLYSISLMYNVSQAEIVKLNPGSDQRIYLGRTLRIPLAANNRTKETFHTIAQGETLYRLTQTYGVSAEVICDANPGLSAENFRIGEVIRIPASSEASTTTQQQSEQSTPQIPDAVQSRCRDMHKVKRRETVFSISKEYGISTSELIAANPELKGENKIKRGTYLCIPYPSESTSQQVKQPTHIPTDTELFDANKDAVKRITTVRAALILPFLQGNRGERSRMQEYYEGFLLAADSLKRSGVSIDLYIYDSGTEQSSLDKILAKPELKQMDVIFGPMYTNHIPQLAAFAQEHHIRLVVPFTSRDNSVFQNPFIYQINTPQSYLYSEVYNHFCRQFAAYRVVFVEASADTEDKKEFIRGLKDELSGHGIPYSAISESVSDDVLLSTIKDDQTTIFIPTSAGNTILIKLLPRLSMIVRNNPEARLALFGYPEWQTYTKDHLNEFFELDTYFYSSFYTNNLLPASIAFIRNYRHWYGHDMEDRYPKYGMLGFDTGYYFMRGLWRYGSEFDKQLDEIRVKPIQTGFKFERVTNFGGFINRKVYFVHFTKTYELLKLDYDSQQP
jgi:LysM repeat protein